MGADPLAHPWGSGLNDPTVRSVLGLEAQGKLSPNPALRGARGGARRGRQMSSAWLGCGNGGARAPGGWTT